MTAVRIVKLTCDGLWERGCPTKSTFEGETESLSDTRWQAAREGWLHKAARDTYPHYYDVCNYCLEQR